MSLCTVFPKGAVHAVMWVMFVLRPRDLYLSEWQNDDDAEGPSAAECPFCLYCDVHNG